MKKEFNKAIISKIINENNLQNYMNTNIYSISELFYFEKNEYLIKSGFTSDYLYFCIDGELGIFTYSNSEKSTCLIYSKNFTMIGEAASLWKIIPNKSVKAITKCTCIGININKYQNLLLNDLKFMQNVSFILAKKMNNIDEISFYSIPLEIRLARFILEHEKNNTFNISLINCSCILNTSYRHLLRNIKLLCDLNILKKTKNEYIIIDKEKLKCISKNK